MISHEAHAEFLRQNNLNQVQLEIVTDILIDVARWIQTHDQERAELSPVQLVNAYMVQSDGAAALCTAAQQQVNQTA